MDVFKKDENFIYLNKPYCEFYIPMYYFDTTVRFAEDLSDHINVLGVFNVGIFENGKLKELKLMNLPTMVDIFVYEHEVKEVTLLNGEVTQCYVCKYLQNSKIMQSRLFDDDENAKRYLQCICAGKLPGIIPYSKTQEFWAKNQSLNGVDFGVSSLYEELILSVMYRDPDNMSKKFSQVADTKSDYDYKMGSIRQICQYNSTFTAITFEDIDSMITTSLNKSREKVKESISPVEQIIKF